MSQQSHGMTAFPKKQGKQKLRCEKRKNDKVLNSKLGDKKLRPPRQLFKLISKKVQLYGADLKP